ncbi:hypothetical protein RBI22_15165 [Alcaligenaceae bacterium C4P045]|nr:hypothetical protein [Alcaligenaceae bacterium C4P045]
MNGNFAAGMSAPLRAGIQALGMAPMAQEQARMQAGLQAAQGAKFGSDAALNNYKLEQLGNPATRAALEQIAPGLGVLFGTGGDVNNIANGAQAAQALSTRRQILGNLGDPGRDPDAINRAIMVSEGKAYEPYANIGETGTAINKGSGAIGVGNPGLAALFGEGARAEIGTKQAQGEKYRADAQNSGKSFDSTRGVVVNTNTSQASPVTGPGGAPLGPSAGNFNKAYDEGKAKQLVEADETIRKAGMQAPGTLAKLDQMEKLVGDYEGGTLTGIGVQAASLGNSLGITIDPKLGDKQAAEALFNEFALKLKNAGGTNQMPGALSDRDLAFLQATAPQLAQTADGRRTIMNSFRSVAQREQQVAKMAEEYKRRNGGRLDDGFFERLSAWSERNTMFGGE